MTYARLMRGAAFVRTPRFGFLLVYALLAVVLLGAAFLTGKGTNYTLVKYRPATCNKKAWIGCVREEIAAVGGGVAVIVHACRKMAGEQEWICDVSIPDPYQPSCYDITIDRAKQGYPLFIGAAQKQC